MSERMQLVVFLLDGRRCALPVSVVEHIVSAVMMTPIPRAPDNVSGIIDVHGQVIPVIDIRRMFHRPERDIDLDDAFIIARALQYTVALHVDGVAGIVACKVSDIFTPEKMYTHLEYIHGVVVLDDGMVVIHNLDAFLSLDELVAGRRDDPQAVRQPWDKAP
jgi:purine-binding chemotaxis protein CheW